MARYRDDEPGRDPWREGYAQPEAQSTRRRASKWADSSSSRNPSAARTVSSANTWSATETHGSFQNGTSTWWRVTTFTDVVSHAGQRTATASKRSSSKPRSSMPRDRRGCDRPRAALEVAEEAPGPLPRPDPHRGQIGQLAAHRVVARRQQVPEREAGAQAERRDVEVVVRDQPRMLFTARAREEDTEHSRSRGPRQPVERPERGQPQPRLAPMRAGERVETCKRVVHIPRCNRRPGYRIPRARRSAGRA